ncbi:hypothetical protein HPP92_014065 [Vanilla planifolia]|uniref:Uncharacterized protein n=1 Tax=Vanilla planifolia TaxID=51239 RepID=A0A835QMU9_VANPL|nr:hypothetical protein HPP92_014506 [Vanilla planifolia]KAG0474379.1 hypothetical protein HPP92_014065 [Vanilla planifolia]
MPTLSPALILENLGGEFPFDQAFGKDEGNEDPKQIEAQEQNMADEKKNEGIVFGSLDLVHASLFLSSKSSNLEDGGPFEYLLSRAMYCSIIGKLDGRRFSSLFGE